MSRDTELYSRGAAGRRPGRADAPRAPWLRAWMAATGLAALSLLIPRQGVAYSGVPKVSSHPSIDRVEKLLAKAGLDAALVNKPLGKARHALGRAQAARDSGDSSHGALLERLAVEWSRMAYASVRAARSEASAQSHASRLRKLRTELERGRALLTELQARRGRLQAEVDRAEQRARQRKQAAAAAESKRLKRAGGKRRPAGRRGAGASPSQPSTGASPRGPGRGGKP